MFWKETMFQGELDADLIDYEEMSDLERYCIRLAEVTFVSPGDVSLVQRFEEHSQVPRCESVQDQRLLDH
jgi:hypothetical protein